ncbi:MAG TPA: lmo0937 family membrane protein [Candidatus Polarisedimenticolaceae bacterium]|nr:lmo0937 family membrane protein [Candidatus Polarisedimenticolaceae bacterium]
MIWTIIGVLLVLWILGFIGKVGGGLIHVLLVIALIVFIYDRLAGKKKV